MLSMLLSKFGGELPVSAVNDVYEVFYGDLLIKICDLKQAEEFAKNFKNKESLKIKRKGE